MQKSSVSEILLLCFPKGKTRHVTGPAKAKRRQVVLTLDTKAEINAKLLHGALMIDYPDILLSGLGSVPVDLSFYCTS